MSQNMELRNATSRNELGMEMHRAIENNDTETFDLLLNNGQYDLSYVRDNNCTTAMKAAYHLRADMLCKLLKSRRTPDRNGSIQRRKSAHESELNTPLEPDPETVLLSVFHGLRNAKNKSNELDFRKCLDHVLNKIPRSELNVNYRDEQGNTPLQYAVKLGDQQLVLRLLNCGSSLCNKNNAGEVLVECIDPETLKKYFDSCIYSNELVPVHPKYEINFIYEIFKPPKNEPEIQEIELLLQLNKMHIPELRDLLEHPIVHGYLEFKWHKVKKLYYLNIGFYVTFCLMLYSYIFYTSCPALGYGSSSDISNDCANLTLPQSTSLPVNSTTPPTTLAFSDNIKYVLRISTIILLVILILRELIQFCISKVQYITSPENWLEILVIVTTIDLLFWNVNTELGSAAILASGFELFLIIGRLPRLSTNTEIFQTVTINFLKFLSCYWILIFSFAFSYNISKRSGEIDAEDNESPLHQLTNTLINYSTSMLVQQKDHSFGNPFSLRHLIFMLNVFFITIVLFSLLNGLAVNDIRKIKKKSRLNGIASRMKSILYIDILAGINFNRFCCCCRDRRGPNSNDEHRNRTWFNKISPFRSRLFPDTLPSCKISVLPNNNMDVRIVDDSNTSSHKLNGWKMDKDIVKRAGKILEQRLNHKMESLDIKSESIYELPNPQSEIISEINAVRIPLEKIPNKENDPESEPDSKISANRDLRGEKIGSDPSSELESEPETRAKKSHRDSKIVAFDVPKWPEPESKIHLHTSSKIAHTEEAIPTKLLSLLKQFNFIEFDLILKEDSSYANHHYGDPHNGTLLHIACRSKGNYKIIKVLLDHGADINLINEERRSTPIHEAIENADLETLNVLLSNEKCDLSLLDGCDRTPAMKAAFLIRANMLAKLLEEMGVRGLPVDHEKLYYSVFKGMKDKPYIKCLDHIRKAKQLPVKDAESYSGIREETAKLHSEAKSLQSVPDLAARQTAV